MITQWKCKCGKQNSIVNRYCPNCSAGIPDDYIATIIREELLWAKDILHKENIAKWQTKAKKRRKFFKKLFFPQFALLILMMSITLFYSWRYFSGLLTAPMFQENFSKLFFGDDNRIILLFGNGFAVFKNKFGALLNGIGSFIGIQGIKGEGFHDALLAVTDLLKLRINEIIKSVGKIDIIERIKGIVDGFIK